MENIRFYIDDFWESSEIPIRNHTAFVKEVKSYLSRLKNKKDKTAFLRSIIESVSYEKEEYLNNSLDKDDTKSYQYVLYFLYQELDEYNLEIEPDDDIQFNKRVDLNCKLDIIINELEKLKTDSETIQKGQVIIIEAFAEEFEELKNLYHYGKKNWRQNFFGKFGEMVASGVVSETISNEVIDIMKEMGQEVKQILISN